MALVQGQRVALRPPKPGPYQRRRSRGATHFRTAAAYGIQRLDISYQGGLPIFRAASVMRSRQRSTGILGLLVLNELVEGHPGKVATDARYVVEDVTKSQTLIK